MPTNPMEQMLMTCPLDMCDGDGTIHDDTGKDGERDYPCPHVAEGKEPDRDEV